MGGGLATASIKVAAIRAADPLAKGLSGVSVALRADAGARALVNEEFKAFGCKATTDLARAKMMDEGAKVTTTFLERMKTACSWDLVKTAPTAAGEVALAGMGSSMQTAAAAGNGANRPPQPSP